MEMELSRKVPTCITVLQFALPGKFHSISSEQFCSRSIFCPSKGNN